MCFAAPSRKKRFFPSIPQKQANESEFRRLRVAHEERLTVRPPREAAKTQSGRNRCDFLLCAAISGNDNHLR
jgi:hypothetical protein